MPTQSAAPKPINDGLLTPDFAASNPFEEIMTADDQDQAGSPVADVVQLADTITTGEAPEAVREQNEAPAGPIVLNDMEFPFGELPAEVLDLDINIGFGRSAEDKRWPSRTMKVGALGAFMSKHEVGAKDGKAFLQGSAIDNNRTAKAMSVMSIVGLDIDSGYPMDAFIAKVRELNLAAIVYTTHSHMKPTTFVNQGAFAKWAGKNGFDQDPTEQSIRLYLKENRGWEAAIADTAEVGESVHTKDGIGYLISHAPMPKYRGLFFLSRPFEFLKQAGLIHTQAINRWKGKLLGLAKIIGVPIDESCLDPSRLFYSPRHDEGKPYRVIAVAGNALDFDVVPEIDNRGRADAPDDDTFARAAEAMGAGAGSLMFGEFSLRAWASATAATVQMAELFRTYATERVRADNHTGKIEVECPFDHEHSNAGDPEDRACFISDAHSEGTDRPFHWGCQHHSCRKRNRLEFVCQALEYGWLTVEQLQDERYQAIIVEEETVTRLPSPFELRGGWIGYVSSAGQDQRFERVCAPFQVIAESCDEHGSNWSVIIGFAGHGRRQRAAVSYGQMHGAPKELRQHLVDRGLRVLGGKAAARFDLLMTQTEAPKRILTVSRPGFHERDGRTVFVTPAGVAMGKDGPYAEVELAESSRMLGHGKAGTLDGWKAAAAAAAAYWPWALGLCAGFAGPLVSLLDLSTSGINITGRSASGKTTAQRLAAAVWGDPRPGRGVLATASSTVNGFEALCARSHATVSLIDELAQLEPRDIGRVVFGFASGTGKTRLARDGSQRANREWSTIVVCSSERPVSAIMASAGQVMLPGQAVRICDVEIASPVDVPRETLALVEACKEHYGHAGEAFVLHLLRHHVDEDGIKALRQELDRLAAELAGVNADSVRGRAAKTFALLWLAGQTAKDAGVLPASADVEGAIRTAWSSFLNGCEGAMLNPEEQALDHLRTAFATGRDVTFAPLGSDPYRTRSVELGYYDDEMLYVLKDKLFDAAGKRLPEQALARTLDRVGILQRESGTSLRHKYLKGMGMVKHYRLSREKLGMPEEHPYMMPRGIAACTGKGPVASPCGETLQ